MYTKFFKIFGLKKIPFTCKNIRLSHTLPNYTVFAKNNVIRKNFMYPGFLTKPLKNVEKTK